MRAGYAGSWASKTRRGPVENGDFVANDPANDLTLITQMMLFRIGIAVKAASPFMSGADVVAFAKANTGKIAYGTTGPASLSNRPAGRARR